MAVLRRKGLWAAAAAVLGVGAVSAGVRGPTVNPDDQYRFGWYFPSSHYEDYRAAGINLMIYCYDSWWYTSDAAARARQTANQRKWIDRFHNDGIDYIEQVKATWGLTRAKPEIRCVKPKNEGTDLTRKDVRDQVFELCRTAANTYTNLPAFVGVAPTTEVGAFVSWTDEADAACLAANGFKMPREFTSAHDAGVWRRKDFPLSGIVREDYAPYRFFTWLAREGCGWNPYMDACTKIYSETLGRPLLQWYDPITRAAPFWGAAGGRNLTAGNQWYYPFPAPYGVSAIIGEEMAMLRDKPDAGVFVMLQGFCYQDYTAPAKRPPADPPEWYRRKQSRGGITTPPDWIREAMWMIFARKIAGYGIYESGALFPSSDGEENMFTGEDAFGVFAELGRTVGVPLGPLFKTIPERKPEVALLESAASDLLAGHGCGRGWGSAMGDMLTGANLMPYVIYEDEIARDGLPPSLKVVVLPDTPVLLRGTAAALREFQKRGGVLVANEWVAPGLLPEVRMPEGLLTRYERTFHGASDRKALDKVGRELKESLAWKYRPYADSENEALVLHVRTYRAADYVFAINDLRTYGDYIGMWKLHEEKGLPNEGVVTLRRADTGAVYDLVRHEAVPFRVRNGQTEIPVSYTTSDGRVLLVAPRKLSALAVRREGNEVVVTSKDRDVMIPIEVSVDGAKPRYGVIENGVWRRPYAKGAKLRVRNLADGRVYQAGVKGN